MPKEINRLSKLQYEIFNDKKTYNATWERLYREIFDTKEIKNRFSNNIIIQIAIWNSKYKEFYPSYPIYNNEFIEDREIEYYKHYIKENYNSFTFTKLIIENSIHSPIKLLLNSKKNYILSKKEGIEIFIKEYLSESEIKNFAHNIYTISTLNIENYSTIDSLISYIKDLKKYKLLNRFNFKTVIIQPIVNSENRILGTISIYSKEKNYTHRNLSYLISILSFKIDNFTKTIILKENEEIKKIKRDKQLLIKTVISSIMSRNISHNIGSHVLVNVEDNMENTPIIEHKKLINYILERMNFITQVSTLWSPEWSLPRFFKKEIFQQFLEQKHILHNIVTTDGLRYIDAKNSNYYIISQKRGLTTEHSFKITDSIKNIKNKNNQLKHNDDVLVDIPGGKIGYHAFYTIIENIIRNSAKYGYATLSNRYQKRQVEINITIDASSYKNRHIVKIWDNVSYISNLHSSLNSKNILSIKLLDIEEIKNEPFIKVILNIDKNEVNIFVHKMEFLDNIGMGLITPSIDFDYKRKINKKNNFFISEARFHSILKNLGDKEDNISLYKRAVNILNIEKNLAPFIKLLKKRTLNPLHISLNRFLRNSLVDNEKNLNENNGLAEIKICALYLSGLDYKDLAKDYNVDGRDREYIKAIAIENYNEDNKNLTCYRLGYKFLLNKPTIYSLKLSDNYRKKLFFIEECIDDSFVLISDKEIDTSLRISKKIISSEFLICDIDEFNIMIENDYKDRLNRLPYRIIVLTDNENEKLNYNEIFIKKRIALLYLSKCTKVNGFKEKILNCWIAHTLNVNRHNRVDVNINLKGSHRSYSTNNIKDIGINLLDKFTDKLLEDSIIDRDKKNLIREIIDDEFKTIIEDTNFQKLFNIDENYGYNTKEQNSNPSPFTYRLNEYNIKYNEKVVLLSRHAKSKLDAYKESKSSKDIVYYESLSGGTNQFWLYRYMFRETTLPIELLFNKLKLLETALYKIAIFDERLLNSIDAKSAKEQHLYIVNEINGYKISRFKEGLSGEFNNDGEFILKEANLKVINIDILIIHYGLLEKIKENSKLSEDKINRVLFSFPLVVLTSGRGIFLDKNSKNSKGHIKFISFPVLKEYFKNSSINKIGLTQMLMNLIGIQNSLSGLYDE